METSSVNTDTDSATTYTPPPATAGRPQLRRAYRGRMLAGVAAGLADYFDVDVTLVRVALVVLSVMGGAGVAAYLACLLLIPEEGSDTSLVSELLGSAQSH